MEKPDIEESEFIVSVDDGFCKWAYGLNIPTDICIQDIIDVLCEKFNAKVEATELVKPYRRRTMVR